VLMKFSAEEKKKIEEVIKNIKL